MSDNPSMPFVLIADVPIEHYYRRVGRMNPLAKPTQTGGASPMIRRSFLAVAVITAMAIVSQPGSAEAQQFQQQSYQQQQPQPQVYSQQQAYQQPMGYQTNWSDQSAQNMDRFYHYPYVYYPQNYYANNYYRSADNMYYRYPAEMRIPVYNRNWHNYYPSPRRYHFGHHFLTDIF